MATGETVAPLPTREQLTEWYRMMLLIRRVEELAAKAYTQKKILGFCHLYIGQEAVAVGASAALRPGDTVVTAYRDHGQIMARGVSARRPARCPVSASSTSSVAT